MCGIFAYINCRKWRSRGEIVGMLVQGLRRLEYRGYDSAGLAMDGGEEGETEKGCRGTLVVRSVGTVDALEKELGCWTDVIGLEEGLLNHVGIAHTRWATHGEPSVRNAHPHCSDRDREFVVVHNGIITNHLALKEMLVARGFVGKEEFESDTDSEVVAKLLRYLYHTVEENGSRPSFPRLVMHLMHALEGAFSFAIRSSWYPGEFIACKRGSPLVVGIRGDRLVSSVMPVMPLKTDLEMKDRPYAPPFTRVAASPHHTDHEEQSQLQEMEYFVSSDASAIIEHTDQVFYPEEGDVVHIRDGTIFLWNVGDDNEQNVVIDRSITTLTMELEQIMKGDYPHFMLKEIFEQPFAAEQTMRGRLIRSRKAGSHEDLSILLGGIRDRASDILSSNRIIFVACGTSYHACLAARQIVEELVAVPCAVELGSDFLDRRCPVFRSDAFIFVSQSGETADTLEVLRYVKRFRALTIGIVNVVGSAISRMTDCGIHLNAGCEIGVASTKVYTSQIVAITMMALHLSQDSLGKSNRRQEICRSLAELPSKIQEVLNQVDEQMRRLADKFFQDTSILLFGRGYQFATCLEGALKIKEISYIHTEGIHAGELKHGPLALVDESMPIILFSSSDSCSHRVHNALQQLLARGGSHRARLVVVCTVDDEPIKAIMASHPNAEIVRVPRTSDCLQSVLHVIPMQLLSYHLAIKRGHNVDQPRHLAKSVTVE